MKLTIRALIETLEELENSGLLDNCDGEVTIVHQPTYPLAEAATGLGWIVRDGGVELVIGANATERNSYADNVQALAFYAEGGELVGEEEEEYEN